MVTAGRRRAAGPIPAVQLLPGEVPVLHLVDLREAHERLQLFERRRQVGPVDRLKPPLRMVF
jgi:hypothetical protein